LSRLRTRSPDAARREDPELLRAVSSGDLGALGELYDRYARDVWRAVRRSLVDPADVEDIVHAVFMKLPQVAASYDGRPTCRAWLCGVAVRLAMRHRRGLGRFQRMLRGFAGSRSAPISASPEQNASDREELLCFGHALARLSAKKRAVFVLVELEGLSSEEAAAALEIPAATVRTRLFHARREIDDALGRRS
jgi:RNA polymerase sigma-70 factor (ECF subfamily)